MIWENQQPLLYDGVNEEDMDTFQFAIGMYEENELYEYSILDSEISTFLNSLGVRTDLLNTGHYGPSKI